uniref:PH domain-containing protein n=1 Tax=Gopherus agassizii TaxID=38772 RepID=A0A452GXI4_9SAUR
ASPQQCPDAPGPCSVPGSPAGSHGRRGTSQEQPEPGQQRPHHLLHQPGGRQGMRGRAGALPGPSRSLRRIHTFGKRENSIKRDPNAPVVIRGWLCKQVWGELGGLWEGCWGAMGLYSREEAVLGSIPLPSYEIRPLPGDGKSRRFTFKVSLRGVSLVGTPQPGEWGLAEHRGMRTYHFSADTQEDMNGWIRAMSQSAAAESDPSTM